MCAVQAECKRIPMNKFFRENALTDAIQYVGIATDEPKRLARLDGKKKVSILAKYGYTEEMAAELCKSRGLYSPAYEFSNRNGCWFCPNRKLEEYAAFKERHPDLWQKLLDLGKTKNLVSYGFRYGMTIEELDIKLQKKGGSKDGY